MNASSSRGRGRGRRLDVSKPLRKPGETVQESKVENEEKPPVHAADASDGNQQERDKVEQDVSGSNNESTITNQATQENKTDAVLQRAVNNPEFVPRRIPQPAGAVNQLHSCSFLPSAALAPEFIPGKPFKRFEETPVERLQAIRVFVSGQIRQVRDDPGLLEEISTHMAKHLSGLIRVEHDLEVVSDLLFEMCVSEQNFQYTGSRLANHLDNSLNPRGLPKTFRVVFLKRCQVENNKFKEDMMYNNPDRVSNFALFLGELLMNYKTNDGDSIKIFRTAVLNIIEELLKSDNRKLLICTGKLLKLTGSVLDENQEELFEKVKQMSLDPNIDRTARDLFDRVCQLKSTNWGKDEKSSQPPPPGASLHASPLYLLDLGNYLEEQNDVLPVFNEEQWNEFAVDDDDYSEDDPEKLYRDACLAQYGQYYPPYAIEEDRGSGIIDQGVDDYDSEFEYFLQQTTGNR